MIRVGFVVHVMQVAGAEVLVRETIRRLGPAIAPTIFCLDRIGTIGEELQRDGVDVLCLDRRPGRDWRVSLRLAREACHRNIQVIHAHQYSPFFYAALAKPLIRSRPRLILTEHGRHFPDSVSPMRRAFNRIVLDRLADAVNACSQFSARALRDVDGFRGNRIEVIANGIETDHYRPADDPAAAKSRLGFDPTRRFVIHVARHHPVKDQATLIRGFAQARPENVELLMVGDGPLRAELEALAASLAAPVRFLGIRRDIPELLQIADLFALTSVSEAASLTLLEAMATGLPAIVTAVGGNPEIVRDGLEGWHIPRGDAAALARALRSAMADPGELRRRGAAARRRALEHYRLDATIAAYARLYRRLAGQR